MQTPSNNYSHPQVTKYTVFVDSSMLIIAICCVIFALAWIKSFFHYYGDVTITGEGLQILTYAWYLCH